jgi:tetraacyldisaccharide 4'-kinase
MNVLRLILLPLSLVFGLVAYVRNKLYDWGIFKSQAFDIAIIGIGNLSTGGTGKTPHCEYLIRLLSARSNIAYLSRGYNRKTRGFFLVEVSSIAEQSGDEALMVKNKFPDTTVAVCESRATGIKRIMMLFPSTEIVILDDAFQHRSIKPTVNILLTDFLNLYTDDFPLPTGRLREFRLGAGRADIIVVTKTEKVLPILLKQHIIGQIRPRPNQKLFFSYLSYSPFIPVPGTTADNPRKKKSSVALFTGIANAIPLLDYLSSQKFNVDHLEFPDHHTYSEKDILRVIELFQKNPCKNRILLTTEKDIIRLQKTNTIALLKNHPVYYISIQVHFHEDAEDSFDTLLEKIILPDRNRRQLSLF